MQGSMFAACLLSVLSSCKHYFFHSFKHLLKQHKQAESFLYLLGLSYEDLEAYRGRRATVRKTKIGQLELQVSKNKS